MKFRSGKPKTRLRKNKIKNNILKRAQKCALFLCSFSRFLGNAEFYFLRFILLNKNVPRGTMKIKFLRDKKSSMNKGYFFGGNAPSLLKKIFQNFAHNLSCPLPFLDFYKGIYFIFEFLLQNENFIAIFLKNAKNNPLNQSKKGCAALPCKNIFLDFSNE